MLNMPFTRMFEFTLWWLCCSPDVLNEQEEEGLVSGGLLAVSSSVLFRTTTPPLAHKNKWEEERAFELKGNVLSHIQQTSARWLISGLVEQQFHSRPAVTSSIFSPLVMTVDGIHRAKIGCLTALTSYWQLQDKHWCKGPGLNLTGWMLVWLDPDRVVE